MNFSVRFTTKNKVKALVDQLGQSGTDILDIIREENPELQNIRTAEITVDTACPMSGHEYCMHITEEYARKSGLFKGAIEREVTVPESFFSQFIIFDTKIKYDRHVKKKGIKILNVVLKKRKIEKKIYGSNSVYKYSKITIGEAWEKAGFPLEWGFK